MTTAAPSDVGTNSRRTDALKRKFARELAIIKLRRIVEAVADDRDTDEPPEPSDVTGRFVAARRRLPTFGNLSRYLDDNRRQNDVPESCDMVVNLPPWIDYGRYRKLPDWELPAPAR